MGVIRFLSRNTFMIVVLAVSMVTFSCSKDEDDDVKMKKEQADYTVMMYGVGGGDLDLYLKYNLDQVQTYGHSEKVNFTAIVKYSADEQEGEGMDGTRLLTMTPEGMDNERMAGPEFRMDDPQNLADFIISSRERFPAKNYVLVLWNHGLEFSMYDQPVNDNYNTAKSSRALLFDDNTEEYGREASLSIFELEEALARVGDKVDLLYWDVCTMNMIEHIYQLREHVDYILGAEHLTPSYGGNYAALIHSLENNPDVLSAMQKYVAEMKDFWLSMLGDYSPYDLTLVDLQYAEEVVQCVKRCADELIAIRDGNESGSQQDLLFHYFLGTMDKNATWFYSPGGYLYFPYNEDEYPATVVDMFYLFRGMGDALCNGVLSTYVTRLGYLLQDFLPVTECFGTPSWVTRISLGLYFDERKFFMEEKEGRPVNSLSKLYKMLDFDKVVGWSRFIEKNSYRKIKEKLDEEGNILYDEDYFPLLEEVTEK